MRNVCSFVYVIMFALLTPLTWAEGPRKTSLQLPPTIARDCQPQLQPSSYGPYGNEHQDPGYSNSFEQDERRLEPGPDEVEERDPDESDARDPGGF
jgi:hypothetical protein